MAIVSSHKGPGRSGERVSLPTRIGVGTHAVQAILGLTSPFWHPHRNQQGSVRTGAAWTSASRQRIWMHRMLRDGVVPATRRQRFCVARNTKRSTDSSPATRWRKRRGSVSSPRHDSAGTEPIDFASSPSPRERSLQADGIPRPSPAKALARARGGHPKRVRQPDVARVGRRVRRQPRDGSRDPAHCGSRRRRGWACGRMSAPLAAEDAVTSVAERRTVVPSSRRLESAIRARTLSAVAGLANQNPCARSPPSPRTMAACSAVSIPSTVTCMP